MLPIVYLSATAAKSFYYFRLISSSADCVDRLFEAKVASLKGYWLFVARFIPLDRMVGVGIGANI